MDELVGEWRNRHTAIGSVRVWSRPQASWPRSVAAQHAFSVAQQRVRAPRVETVARAARGTESGPGAEVGHKNPGSRALRGI